MSVVSTCANVINVESEKRFFDESLAHVCARIVKYVDSLELLDESDQIVARVSCEDIDVEEYKQTSKSTAYFADKIDETRKFNVEFLNVETSELESYEVETKVPEWKYRRDERRGTFIDELKKAINKIDDSLVSIKQASTLSQEEIDLKAKIKALNAQAKAARELLKKAAQERKEVTS
jgi:hypothetical protein